MGGVQEPLTPPPKKRWWHDRAIVVGIIGVFATIAVGAVTYWLTAGTVSREYQERIKTARNDVLAAVGRSIGEGVVPNKEKIEAVISSNERQYGVKEQDSEKPETVIDDIVERVLANEFLDAKRREELSTKLLAVKNEKTTATTESQPKQPLESKNRIALEIAVIAASITASTTLFVGLRLVSAHGKLYFRTFMPVIMTIFLMLITVAFLSVSPAGQEFLKSLSPPDHPSSAK